MTETKQSEAPRTNANKLGTFAGVFTPSVLTILGIILFLRLGYVVGNAGLMNALIIIAIANSISVLTSISLSAVATNLKVQGGGDYYLISRTLGLEFGGALGIVLYLAQSVSIAFYCIGFGEAIVALSGHPLLTPRLVALAAVALLFILAWLGADWATRFQYGVMALLAASLVSFYIGGISSWNTARIAENWMAPTSGPGFWVLFAIFFPAVTGFTQGVSMSGDLRDPGKSLPLGTFMAVGISILVYFSAAIVFAATLPLADLRQNYTAMKSVSALGVLIDAGVIAATLSSAMASFLGAPRILQSLAKDRIFGILNPFAKGTGASDNPRRGVLLSLGIALITIAIGKLNVIAPVVSMFFLISYGLLNYGTFFEARAQSPSFRPRFKYFDYRLSLIGFLACAGVMLAINPTAGVVALSLLIAIYQYLKRTAGPARWADSRRSWSLQRIRTHLQEAAAAPEHPRDWRPHILALSNDTHRRHRLLRFSEYIVGGSGFVTAVEILEGEGSRMIQRQHEAETELRKDIAAHGHTAFPLAVFAHEFESALLTLVQSYGIGPLKANTVMLNWYGTQTAGDAERRERLNHCLTGAYRYGCNILIGSFQDSILGGDDVEEVPKKTIDVWWEEDATGRLCLLLAYLMTRHAVWENADIRVMTSDERYLDPKGRDTFREHVEEARIDAEIKFVASCHAQEVAGLSAESDMVFLPFRFKGADVLSLDGHPASEMLRWLQSTLLVRAAEDIDLDAAPEEGEAGEIAITMDALKDARSKAAAAAKDAEAAKFALKRLREAPDRDATPEILVRIRQEAHRARQAAEKSARRAAKARGIVELLEQEMAEKGIAVEPPKDEPEENA